VIVPNAPLPGSTPISIWMVRHMTEFHVYWISSNILWHAGLICCQYLIAFAIGRVLANVSVRTELLYILCAYNYPRWTKTLYTYGIILLLLFFFCRRWVGGGCDVLKQYNNVVLYITRVCVYIYILQTKRFRIYIYIYRIYRWKWAFFFFQPIPAASGAHHSPAFTRCCIDPLPRVPLGDC